MGKTYTINLFDLDSYNKTIDGLVKLKEMITSESFMSFIADKCIMELSRISNEKLGGIREDDVTYSEIDKYRSNHKVKVGNNYVIVSNKTLADLSHLSEKTLGNYPDGISVSQIIEFGTGISGTSDSDSGWITQMNPRRDYNKGWYYDRGDGRIRWSKGMAGKFIYYELTESVRKNFQNWFEEFVKNV